MADDNHCNQGGIRHRGNKFENNHSKTADGNKMQQLTSSTQYEAENRANIPQSGTYWLTRIVFLRFLAFVYFVAFLVALNQNKQLLGLDGLLPIPNFLENVRNYFGGELRLSTFQAVPTLLWAVQSDEIDKYLDIIAYCGALLSLFVLFTGCCSMAIMLALWILYHSFVNVGQRWYSFGWESQLLETGFLAIFLCPVVKLCQLPEQTPTSLVVVFGYRWLLFRIMLGAGMIKIRGDQCWRDLTCMNYHYQTQPVPNPMSYYFHQSPEIFHKFETLSNHFIELIVPWFLLLPRRFTIICGVLQIIFQVVLILSGNLSFLNWLTILPSIMCFDDKALACCFSASSYARRQVCKLQKLHNEGHLKPSRGLHIRWIMDVFLGLLLAYLSIPVAQNLFSSRQIMNTSFDSLRIVNTYGAFGSVTKERTEIILQGTRNKTSYGKDVLWQEYEFKCKPGDVKRRPCIISPYHYRLDWLMWFAAFQDYQHNPWLIHLAAKLLVNDPGATSLIAHNPFVNGPPPSSDRDTRYTRLQSVAVFIKILGAPNDQNLVAGAQKLVRFIRADHYQYEFTKFGSQEARDGKWWTRRKFATYFHPISLKDVKEYLRAQGWKIPKS